MRTKEKRLLAIGEFQRVFRGHKGREQAEVERRVGWAGRRLGEQGRPKLTVVSRIGPTTAVVRREVDSWSLAAGPVSIRGAQ